MIRVERQHLPDWGRCAGACGGSGPIVARVYFENGWMVYLCAEDLQQVEPTCAHDVLLTDGCGDCWGSDTPRH